MEYDKFTADDLADVPQPDQALLNMFVRLQEIHNSLTPERIASSVNYDVDRIAFLSQVMQYKISPELSRWRRGGERKVLQANEDRGCLGQDPVERGAPSG